MRRRAPCFGSSGNPTLRALAAVLWLVWSAVGSRAANAQAISGGVPAVVPSATAEEATASPALSSPAIASPAIPSPAIPSPAMGTASPATGAGAEAAAESSPEAQPPVAPQTKELEAADPKVAALAAHRLLQELAAPETPENADRVRATREYVLSRLDPARLAAPDSSPVVTERIVDAMATWITASGPPLPNTAEVLLPLVGNGPQSLRENVIRAVQALIRHEAAKAAPSAAGSSTMKAISNALSAPGTASPSIPFVRDASRILWDADGKVLLDALVSSLAARSASPEGSPESSVALASLEELRARIPRDFPNVDGWQKWWKENRELTLDAILAGCWARNREEFVLVWKQVIRRLRESGNADRLLVALQDTVGGSYTSDLRVAGVLALGDFAEWIVDMRIEEGNGGGENSKDKLMRRAVQLLLPIPVRTGSYVERPEVARAALTALSKYHAFFERAPELREEASRIVLAKLDELSRRTSPEARLQLIETVRLAGALRLEGARGFVEALISRSQEEGARPTSGPDLDLLVSSITTLGRLVEKGGLDTPAADILIRCFEGTSAGGSAALGDLRRACVTALGAGAADEALRVRLLGFHRKLLADDGELRIPAILALGTLARQGTADALSALVDILEDQGDYEPQEVNAAIDSVAYVGGDAALIAFIAHASAFGDKRIQDHLLKKTCALVAAGGLRALAAAMERLEAISLLDGGVPSAEFAEALCQDTQVEALITSARQASASDDRVDFLWRVLLSRARFADLLGDDKAVATRIAALDEVLQKSPGLKERTPRGVQDLAELRRAIERRAAVKDVFTGFDGVDPAPVVKDLCSLATPATSVPVRWLNLIWIARLIETAEPSDRTERVRDGWIQVVASEPSRDVWEALPAASRTRYLERLEALKARGKAAPKPKVGAP